ncbi:conserved hypothetical protein [Parafrankia sp. EAN1pec]|uniref:hypothetical protein n=1 Tax=Parafrankia sp. (strain EAN1pec) TaxID=298653 RepID=UPI0000540D33|nr:conserved hypothetical protein [Frankia sp. EAN1pec]
MSPDTAPVIYPARRAVEHAVSLPGVRPLRLFPVLWPLRQVEIIAFVDDEQAYEVIDHFLVRGIAEGQISRITDLAWFLALPEALVRRCVDFLRTIGHLQVAGDRLLLTDLGIRSWQAGIRYEAKESRQHLLFERRTGWPLPRRYYQGDVAVLPDLNVPDERLRDRSRFLGMFDATPWRPDVVHALTARPDRAEYNLPGTLSDLRVLGERDVYLPVYLVETVGHGVFVYTALAEEPDRLFADVVTQIGTVGDLIEAEGLLEPRQIWTEWLTKSSVGPGVLKKGGSGVWRIVLPAASFGPARGQLAVTRVGSYELRRHHFAQLWCDDAEVRRRAVRERALGLSRSRGVDSADDLRERVAPVARALQVPAPSLDELRTFAARSGRTREVARLEALAAAASRRP